MTRLVLALLAMALLACESTPPTTVPVAETRVWSTRVPTATTVATSTHTSTVPEPTWTPTCTVVPAMPTSQPTLTPEPVSTGWQSIVKGIEVRSLEVAVESGVERVTVVRLAPSAVRFQVVYSPGSPYPISTWAERLGALVALNAGYFTAEYHVIGLTISDGRTYGTPYGDFAGMLAITEDDVASIRWLRQRPYDPQEGLREAVQCFPVLVKPGGVMGFPADADDGHTARRTVVAQDRDGHILVLVAPQGLLSLHALAVWLVSSDLDIDIALNLDGGPSSGLWVAGVVELESLVPVPAAIVVMQR